MKGYIFIFLLITLVSSCFVVSSSSLSGAVAETLNTSRMNISDLPGSLYSQAENVTNIDVFGYTLTQAWQGYFGNVSGVIQLGNANGNVMYNWSVASPKGEVYASTNSSIQWTYIQCFNFTANGTYEDDTGNAGATNKFGTNLTILHNEYGITSSGEGDSVENTFNLFGVGGHPVFYTASNQFSIGECKSTKVYDNTGTGTFHEALLYEPQTTSIIYASLIDQDAVGFNGASSDFEMIVLENGHDADSVAIPYYFYVELQ